MAKSITTKKTAPKKAAPKKVAKKTAAKTKPDKNEKTISIKYADKSAGQPELVTIFEAIKKMMMPYDKKGALVLHTGTGGQANLVSHKPVVIADRKREEVWFVSALVQKGYVGFYYMPINALAEMRKMFSTEFMKCLKGKACFHIRKNDPELMAEIKKAIEIGYEGYKKKGWL
jgi:hypothetical protein